MAPRDQNAPPNSNETSQTTGIIETSSKTPTDGIDLSTENPFCTIWLKPRATIRGIVSLNPAFRVLPLAIVGGILEVLQLEYLAFVGDQLSIVSILLIALAFGPPFGLIFLYAG